MTGPFMVAAGWKLSAQALFVVAALAAFAMQEREAGMLLLGFVGGSVIPVAERKT